MFQKISLVVLVSVCVQLLLAVPALPIVDPTTLDGSSPGYATPLIVADHQWDATPDGAAPARRDPEADRQGHEGALHETEVSALTSTPTFWGTEVTFSPPFLGDFGPQVTTLSDGTFAIAWERQGGNLVARHFDELGNFTGGDLLAALSGSIANPLSGPQIFQQVDGRVVVHFTEEFAADDHDVRWISAIPTSSPFSIEWTAFDEVLLDSTARADGGAAFVYAFGDFGDLVLRFTDAVGNQASPQIFVGPHAGEVQHRPALAGRHTGFVTVAYENFNLTTFARDIRLHTYAQNGVDVSGEVIVSSPGADASFPDIAAFNDGSFVVAWQQQGGIAFRSFFGNATPSSPPLLIPGSVGGLLPKITPLRDYGYIIAWTAANGTESDGSPDLDVFLQRFTTNDQAFGQRVHIDKPGDQGFFGMSIATLDDGRVILAYQSETGDATSVTTLNYQIVDPREASISGTNNDDNIVGREDGSQISGGDGNDKLTGRGASDTLDGEAGNDVLDGGAGADTMRGGPGNDVYVVDNPGDRVDESVAGSSGVDTVRSSISLSLGNTTIVQGTVENLTLLGSANLNGTGTALGNVITGNAGNNTLDGGDGDDELRGEAGWDKLLGGPGNDTLVGGLDQDRLTGGQGSDRFLFTAVEESGVAASERDVITDFQQGLDRIDLSAIDADTTSAGDQAFTFIGTSVFTAPGQVRFVRDAARGRTIVDGNVDGDVTPEFRIELSGLHNPTADDFEL